MQHWPVPSKLCDLYLTVSKEFDLLENMLFGL